MADPVPDVAAKPCYCDPGVACTPHCDSVPDVAATLRRDLLVPLDVAAQHTKMLVEQDYTAEERENVGAIVSASIDDVRTALFSFYSQRSVPDVEADTELVRKVIPWTSGGHPTPYVEDKDAALAALSRLVAQAETAAERPIWRDVLAAEARAVAAEAERDEAIETVTYLRDQLGDTTDGLIKRAEAAEAEAATLREALADRDHFARRMLQAYDGYCEHCDGLTPGKHPRSRSNAEDWWTRFTTYRSRLAAAGREDSQ